MTDLYEMPGHLIRRAQRRAVALFMARMGMMGHDLTPVQFGAMSVIGDDPGIDQATLAQRIAYDRVTIGGVVDRLCQKGYVDRLVSAKDRRSRVLSLTESGNRVLDDVLPAVLSAQDDILQSFAPEERRVFMALLRRLVREDDQIDTGTPE